MEIEHIQKDEFYAWLKSIKEYNGVTKADRKFFGDMRIAILYKCSLLTIKRGEKILSILCYTITNEYLNVYFQYTMPDERCKGMQTKLIDWCLQNYQFNRIFVRASTQESFLFFTSKMFTPYGKDKDGSMLFELHINETNKPIKSLKYIV